MPPKRDIPGAVILAGDGRPLRALGGSLSVFPSIGRAAEIAAAYTGYRSMAALGPFTVAACTVVVREQKAEVGRQKPVNGHR